jgi:uncharacterized protein YkwD
MKIYRSAFLTILPLVVLSFISVPSAIGQSASAQGRTEVRYPPKPKGVISRPRVIADSASSEKENGAASGGSVSIAKTREFERRVFDLINERRREKGLRPLSWNSKVADVARVHSGEMALYDYFSHTGLDGHLVDKRAIDHGLDKWSAIGENIAYLRGYDDPAEYAVERWMLSPSHRDNLLDPRWRETGIGLAVARDGTFFFTQVFMVN